MLRRISTRALPLLAAICALAAAAAAPAHASRDQESVFQDDRLLLTNDAGVRDRALDEIQGLGADTIHALVQWSRIAPNPNSTTRPSGFDASNPAAYPAGSWDYLDGLVRDARARGLDLILTPTGPFPAWASGCRGKVAVRRICDPSPAEYHSFFTALARRYSGNYPDENGSGVLPRVSRWSIWNEPNLGSWLTPQYAGSSRHPQPVSAFHYRALVYAAGAALASTGHGSDQLLLGETAPLGHTTGRPATRSTPPLAFYRDLFCLGSRGRPLHGRAATQRGCSRHFKPLPVTAVSHHPYTRAAARSPASRSGRDNLPLASIRSLERLLDRAAAARRVPAHLPIYFTEYGVQTRPPDPFGVRPSTQATWLNEADWMAFRDPRIMSVAQFELTDSPQVAVFNTGLRYYKRGRAKPSLAAYRIPIWVVRTRSGVNVYGQVRPAAPGAADAVDIQRRSSSKAKWKTVAQGHIGGRHGFLFASVRVRGGRWRLVWHAPAGSPYGDGKAYASREAVPARR